MLIKILVPCNNHSSIYLDENEGLRSLGAMCDAGISLGAVYS